ncbi:MAG: YrbL family protein [Alphaproteobacteria bacterium]|nr:YrbL family protein [Alphaproteobacteria bacterium]
MLILENCIGNGAVRECYIHPFDKSKCVKVLSSSKDYRILKREIKYYPYIQAILGDFIVEYENELVQTNKGLGLVCELLRDDNDELSKPISSYKMDKELKTELDFFVYNLIQHDLFFYDFNLKNFVVQIKNGEKKLKFIDLKSFESNKSWSFLKMEILIPQLARTIMIRRIKRLYQMLGIELFQVSGNPTKNQWSKIK